MTIQTRIHDAQARVDREREAVDAKLTAIDRFIDRVADIAPAPTGSSPGLTATVGALSHRGSDDSCTAVRRAFAETIRPHSLDDVAERESLQATIEAELSESIAVALAPTTNAGFSPKLKRAVLSEARTRRAETKALHCALGREATQLEEVAAAVDEVTEWIATADETPLSDLGFEALRRRHERLATHREECDRVAERRQSFLDGATNHGAEVGIDHGHLGSYIYQDFPTDHPVLTTVVRLDDACRECQRAVRDHLVRRV